MEGHPSAGFDVSITVEDVDEVVQSLSKQISIQLGNTRTQNVDFALAVNPREQHVLVQAWRVISQRIGRNILQWRNNIGRYSLYFTAQRTVWPMQLDTFEAYAQGRATTTACIPEDAKSTGGGTDLSILQTMNLQWNTRRASSPRSFSIDIDIAHSPNKTFVCQTMATCYDQCLTKCFRHCLLPWAIPVSSMSAMAGDLPIRKASSNRPAVWCSRLPFARFLSPPPFPLSAKKTRTVCLSRIVLYCFLCIRASWQLASVTIERAREKERKKKKQTDMPPPSHCSKSP
jgi:hypothetical protein